jgi:hypothetical protein
MGQLRSARLCAGVSRFGKPRLLSSTRRPTDLGAADDRPEQIGASINWKEVGRTTRQSLQVYGRIPPQAAEPGAYSDTVGNAASSFGFQIGSSNFDSSSRRYIQNN